MALLDTSGISNGGAIQASHVTNIYDTLNGVGSFTIIATGSLQGSSSFATSASFASTALSVNKLNQTLNVNGNTIITGSLTVTNGIANSLLMGGLYNDVVATASTSGSEMKKIWSYSQNSYVNSGPFDFTDNIWYIAIDVFVHGSNGVSGNLWENSTLTKIGGGTVTGHALSNGTTTTVTQASSSMSNDNNLQFGITSSFNTASIFVKGLVTTPMNWYATVKYSVQSFSSVGGYI